MWSRCLTLTLHNKKCLSHLSLTAEQALQQIKHASIVTVFFFITHNWKVNNKWYWAAPLGALMSNPKNTSPAALMLRLISFGTFLASFPLCRTNVMIAFGSRAQTQRHSPSSSFRVRLAISLISMRDSEREVVLAIMGAGPITLGAGAVSTLLTNGDLRGLSMLRPTRLLNGIL